MGVAACNPPPAGDVTATVTAAPGATVGEGTATFSDGTTITGTIPVYPDGTPTIVVIPCPTPTATPTPTPSPTPTPTTIDIAIEYLQKYSPTGRAQWNYLVSIDRDKVEYNTPGDCRGLATDPIKVPGPSCAKSSATYIAGTIAHEAFHIAHPHSDSLWEEYGASLTGDIVRDEIIRAGKGTSSDMRFQLSVYTVNINNPDRDQLSQDLIDWFDHNNLDKYFLPKPNGYGYDPLPP